MSSSKNFETKVEKITSTNDPLGLGPKIILYDNSDAVYNQVFSYFLPQQIIILFLLFFKKICFWKKNVAWIKTQ